MNFMKAEKKYKELSHLWEMIKLDEKVLSKKKKVRK
jgi:hypothetical protein